MAAAVARGQVVAVRPSRDEHLWMVRLPRQELNVVKGPHHHGDPAFIVFGKPLSDIALGKANVRWTFALFEDCNTRPAAGIARKLGPIAPAFAPLERLLMTGI